MEQYKDGETVFFVSCGEYFKGTVKVENGEVIGINNVEINKLEFKTPIPKSGKTPDNKGKEEC